jgi:hypothetical protein
VQDRFNGGPHGLDRQAGFVPRPQDRAASTEGEQPTEDEFEDFVATALKVHPMACQGSTRTRTRKSEGLKGC